MSKFSSGENANSHEYSSTMWSRFAHGTSSLRHRNFSLLWIGTFASNVGSWMQKVATAWLLYQLTNSAAWLGIDAFASGIPTVLLLPWGGVLADRVNRRTLLIWTNVLAGLVAFILGLLVMLDRLRIWHIILASIISGVLQALMAPASSSLLPQIVGEQDTANAIALNSLQFNLSRVVGPAIAGIALTHLGVSWCFSLNGFSFLVLVVTLGLIRNLPREPLNSAHDSVIRNLGDGLKFLRRRSDVLTLLILVILTSLLGSPMISMMPALTKSILQQSSSTYSLLLSSFGIGAVIAAVVVAAQSRRGPRPKLAIPLLAVLSACEIVIGVKMPLALASSIVALAGFAFISTMIRLGTAILQSSPNEFRGRVTSFQSLGFRAAQPIGSLLAGCIAELFGVRIAFWSFGLSLFIAVLLALQFGEFPLGIYFENN